MLGLGPGWTGVRVIRVGMYLGDVESGGGYLCEWDPVCWVGAWWRSCRSRVLYTREQATDVWNDMCSLF